jgi:probable HAF family extracellular repeat protein
MVQVRLSASFAMLRNPIQALMLMTAVTAGGHALPIYNVQGVGPAAAASTAAAISSNGIVAGNYQATDGSWQAFLFQNGQISMVPLGAGGYQNMLSGVNRQGVAAGQSYSLSGQVSATAWSNLSPQVIESGFALAINDNGTVGGMRIRADGSGQAFIQTNGIMRSVSGLPESFSAIYGLNNAGAAVGYAMNSDGFMRAFQVDTAGNVTFLNPTGGANSYAMAINGAQVAAGHSQTASGALYATTWTNGAANLLGTLGGTNSGAYSINSLGRVVGFSDLPGAAGTAAFLYYDGILADLNTRIDPNSGWRLLAAYGINDTGQIVGRGLFQGVEQAFLLTPQTGPIGAGGLQLFTATEAPSIANPEPATIYTFLAGAGLLVVAMRRRKA